MDRSQDQHRIAGVDLRDQGCEIVLLYAVGRMGPLAPVAGETYPNIFFPDVECDDLGLALKLLRNPSLQRIGVALPTLASVDDQYLFHKMTSSI